MKQFVSCITVTKHKERLLWYNIIESQVVIKPNVKTWLDDTMGVDHWDHTLECSNMSSWNPHLFAEISFSFDTEEDQLLFTLRWLTETDSKEIFWHPV